MFKLPKMKLFDKFRKKHQVELTFKDGDVIKNNIDSEIRIVDSNIKNDLTEFYFITIEKSNQYKNDYTIATQEEIDTWNSEVLHPNHLHYSRSQEKLIDWFLPFDRVVVRNSYSWKSRQFDFCYKDYNETPVYACQDGQSYYTCLRYTDKTSKLIGTNHD